MTKLPIPVSAEMVRQLLTGQANEYLGETRKALRNDAGPLATARFLGVVRALAAVGLLTDEQAELWERRIATCPGHGDEGGRVWCAYCGGWLDERTEVA